MKTTINKTQIEKIIKDHYQNTKKFRNTNLSVVLMYFCFYDEIIGLIKSDNHSVCESINEDKIEQIIREYFKTRSVCLKCNMNGNDKNGFVRFIIKAIVDLE